MIEYLKKHIQYFAMVVGWVITGIYLSPLHLAVIPLSLLLLKWRNLYPEMIIGFFVIVILADSLGESMSWARGIKDIYLVMMAVLFLFNLKEFRYRNNLWYAFIPFFVLAVILIFRSPDLKTCSLKTFSFIIVYSILPFYYFKAINEDKDRFFKGFVLAISILLFYGLIMIVLFPDSAYISGRYKGVMGNPNGLGILCTVFFALFTIIISDRKNLFSKPEIIAVYALIIISVLLSASRNSLISILIFYCFSRFFKVSYFLGFVLIIIIGITYQLVITNLPQILAAMGLQQYLRVENLEDGSGRLIAWKFAMQQIQQNFMIGKGINYEIWIFDQHKMYLYRFGPIGNSHNSWLAMWLNTGLVGLVMYASAFIYRFVKVAGSSPYVLPLMYCVLFSATFEAWLVGSLNPYTPMLLLMWSYFEVASATEKAPEKELVSHPVNQPQLA